ncbi:hypothetical protein NYE24_19655 [Paenibacillus sp. FSL H7-0350]|uniref:hypothetical protein n=1 Tax=Paenibacillus sp. FSL H7-0350 TaxID=2975345 RepID=UPI003158647C
MKILKITVEFEMNEGEASIEKFRGFLDAYLNQEITEVEDDEQDGDFVGELVKNEKDGIVESEHLDRLRRFRDGLSQKQQQVWNYFMNHPGLVYSDDLRQALPILEKHGALSGVFRATRRWVGLGGEKETSPFAQVSWSHERGCGLYRGLTDAEVQSLSKY